MKRLNYFLYQKTTGFLMFISKNQRFFDALFKIHVSGQSPDTFTTWNSSRWYKICDFKKESLPQHTQNLYIGVLVDCLSSYAHSIDFFLSRGVNFHTQTNTHTDAINLTGRPK